MIFIKTADEIARMREAGKVVALVLKEIRQKANPGIKTEELNRLANGIFAEYKVKSAFLGYRSYPASICTSVNEQVVHGIPSGRTLKTGDLLGVDVGVLLNGYYADAASTFPVGEISQKASILLETGYKALENAIDACIAGKRLYDVSSEIQKTAEKKGFSVVRDFVGHGIGQQMHEEPQVPNFGRPGTGPLLKNGMVLALEPMINEGTYEVKVLDDGWTVVTLDGKLSCHFEHTVAITENGPEVLTA